MAVSTLTLVMQLLPNHPSPELSSSCKTETPYPFSNNPILSTRQSLASTILLSVLINFIFLGTSYEVKWKSLSHVQLFATAWTTQSMAFSRPEYWSGWPFPSPEDLPNPGIEPRSHVLQVDSLPADLWGKPRTLYKWNQIFVLLCLDYFT